MISSHLRASLCYPRFVGETPTVLVFDTGYFVVEDVLDASSALGWKTVRLPTAQHGHGEQDFIARLLTALVEHKPDFVLTVNHLGFDEHGHLARLLDDYRIPLASWFVDHPLPILGGTAGNVTPTTQVFCFERTAIPWLAREGFSEPVYLPTASNQRYYHPDRLDPVHVEALRFPLTFVGSSWWIQARKRPSPELSAAARAYYQAHRVNRSALVENYDGFIGQMPVAETWSQRDAAQVVLAEASMQTRSVFVRHMQELGVRVYGDRHWLDLVPDLDLRPSLDYATELPAAFAASGINLNISAEQMPTAVNQRLWDVPGAGGFLLTDAQEDVFDFFKEDQEVVVYRTVDEAKDKVRYYVARERQRKDITMRAYEKVNQNHRYTHRLLFMARVMKKRFQ